MPWCCVLLALLAAHASSLRVRPHDQLDLSELPKDAEAPMTLDIGGPPLDDDSVKRFIAKDKLKTLIESHKNMPRFTSHTDPSVTFSADVDISPSRKEEPELDLPPQTSSSDRARTVTDIILDGKKPPSQEKPGQGSSSKDDLQSELATGAKKNIQAQQQVMWTYIKAIRKLETETVRCLNDRTCKIPKTKTHEFWVKKLHMDKLLAAVSNSSVVQPVANATVNSDPDFGADVDELTRSVTNQLPKSEEDEKRELEKQRTTWFLAVTVFEFQRLERRAAIDISRKRMQWQNYMDDRIADANAA